MWLLLLSSKAMAIHQPIYFRQFESIDSRWFELKTHQTCSDSISNNNTRIIYYIFDDSMAEMEKEEPGDNLMQPISSVFSSWKIHTNFRNKSCWTATTTTTTTKFVISNFNRIVCVLAFGWRAVDNTNNMDDELLPFPWKSIRTFALGCFECSAY